MSIKNTKPRTDIEFSALPGDDTLMGLSEFFKSFSDLTRMKLMLVLCQKEACVGELSEILNATASAVSHQLKILRQLKLVKCRREGKNMYYSLDDLHVQQIIKLGLTHINEK